MAIEGRQVKAPFPAYKGDEPYVFACYSHEDAAVVFAELERLRGGGVNVYYDEGISPGAEWTQELADAIDGCSQLLYFVSRSAAASRHCRNEVQYALERAKPVISVYLEPTELPGGLQLSLGSAQAIMKHDLNDEDYRRKLFEAFGSREAATGSRLRARPESRPARASSRFRVVAVAAVAALLVVALSSVYLDWSGPPRTRTVTVAVIPFEALASAQAEPDLAAGFAIEIGNQLGKIGELRVTARSAVQAELNQGFGSIEVGRRLGATHVVEGSLRIADDRMLANVQLVDANTQIRVWAETFDETVEDFFALQGRVALAVASALGAKLSDDERSRIEAPPTENLEAYRLFSRFYFAGADPQDNRRATALLEESIELDPDFTDAISWLAERKAWACWTGDRESCSEVHPLAERAMALDSRSAMANWALAWAEIVDGNVGLGVQILHRAHALAPSLPQPAADLALFAGLIGDLEESLGAAVQGVKLNPRDLVARWTVAVALRRLGDHDRAQRWLQHSLAELADAPDDARRGRVLGALGWLRVGYGEVSLTPEEIRFAWANLSQPPMLRASWGGRFLAAGEWGELRRWLEPLASERPMLRPGLDDVPMARSVRTQLAFALKQLGEEKASMQLFDESLASTMRALERQAERPFLPLELAAIYAVKGDNDSAVGWLDEAYDAGLREHRYLRLDPMFETLNGDPRFEAVLTKMQEDVNRKLANVAALGLLDELERMMSENGKETRVDA